MIKKHRTKPEMLEKLDILQRRLPDLQPGKEQIKQRALRCRAGYRGEKAIDYHLSFIEAPHLILHDLRLLGRTSHFQMDTLLLTPYFSLIIEVKNIAGTLHFDDYRYQMTRRLHGEEEGFLDPRLQVRRHKLQLEEWLSDHSLVLPPIYPLVVISFPSTIIQASSTNVIHAAQLPFEITTYKKEQEKPTLPFAGIQTTADKLIQLCRPKMVDILQEFELTPDDIQKGVQCLECPNGWMRKMKNGFWCCRSCGCRGKDASLQALRDYRALISPFLTTEQCRDFLDLSFIQLTLRLLRSLNVPHNRKNKGRMYDLSRV
ncbi:nuclease-related domain-containing protein [Salibacterium halotolerans]|uniref:Nuclease-related domain-containing protein n=1 Tax=Salibacterium halotolerans TaxID=1884432 RepID=A0A1I5WXH1_9BACI|nr:nuclease-related domain-containing protein [Salibacterium halotolerans]SFQ24384.1 Nuclease-related domain-containing protein [Salibacterium halotolerans]